MPELERDGITFHWEERGEGQPFIFQHGLGGDVSQPLGLFSPPPDIRLIALDCRAHGQTHPVGDDTKINFATFADDLAALLDELRVQQAVLGGISMGAAVALTFALRYPARVTALVLSRPAWMDAPNPFNVEAFAQIASLIRSHGAAAGKAAFEASRYLVEVKAESLDAAASLLSQFDSQHAEDGVARLERIPKESPHPDRSVWNAVQVPVLILAVKGDPIHPCAYAEEMAAAFPDARLRDLTPKHVSADQHAADTQRHIEQFFKEISC